VNNISDFEAHKRDEAFNREDAKSGHVSHADRVRFADAMMRPVFDEECELCNGTGKVHGKPGPGGVITTVECDCGYSEP
jgi:hypothetical protein